jgi:hypothetical protein
MVVASTQGRDLSKEGVMIRAVATFFEHAAVIALGVVLMVFGLALGVTMIMLPVGVVVGLTGVLLVVGGLFARITPAAQ